MKKVFYLAIASIVCAMTACGPKYEQPEEGSNIGFALNFIRKVSETIDHDKNMAVSPYSAGVALSMLAEGAEGVTREELDAALNQCLFKAEDLGSNDTVIVKSANSVWVAEYFKVRNKYATLLENEYDAMIKALDFSDPASLDIINGWCSDHTEGKIPEIADKLAANTVMLLMNALYFNAPWADSFDPERTQTKMFRGVSGDKEVSMMNRRAKYQYAEYQGCSMIQLPYSGGRYSMYVVLPPEGISPETILQYVNETAFDAALSMMSEREVILSLPKFKIETEMVLNETLRRLGVKAAFTSGAQFDGISEMGPLAVDQVKQKCFVEVSEKGTEAAAVTVVQIKLTSARPSADRPVVMNVDRPFLFVITDSVADNILFAGKIVNL